MEAKDKLIKNLEKKINKFIYVDRDFDRQYVIYKDGKEGEGHGYTYSSEKIIDKLNEVIERINLLSDLILNK
jgi:hypothetical protein